MSNYCTRQTQQIAIDKIGKNQDTVIMKEDKAKFTIYYNSTQDGKCVSILNPDQLSVGDRDPTKDIESRVHRTLTIKLHLDNKQYKIDYPLSSNPT